MHSRFSVIASCGALCFLALVSGVHGQEAVVGTDEASPLGEVPVIEQLKSDNSAPLPSGDEGGASRFRVAHADAKERFAEVTENHANKATKQYIHPLRGVLRIGVPLLMLVGLVGAVWENMRRLSAGDQEDKVTSVTTLIRNRWELAVSEGHCYLGYACFLLGVFVYYNFMSRNYEHDFYRPDAFFDYLGSALESTGLMVLRRKMAMRRSAEGISRTTIQMYAITYFCRMFFDCPDEEFPWAGVQTKFDMLMMQSWISMLLQVVTLLLVLDCLFAVSVTYKATCEEDLDEIQVTKIFPACVLVAVVLHPLKRSGHVHSIVWTASLYNDTVALLPQVVMMARSSGKIATPIAHFVAATAVGRAADLVNWVRWHELGPQGYIYGFNFSGWLIIWVHVLNLVLVADFMWYYAKAWTSGTALSAEMSIDTVVDII